MEPPLAKRSLRPTASLPTTAETYGQKFGIDPSVQVALQNIGRKSRQNIAQPSFNRTATAPSVSFNAPSSSSNSNSGFQTSHEIMEHAHGIINKEAWRRSTRELQPFGSGSDIASNETESIVTPALERGEPFPQPARGGIKRANSDFTAEEEEDDGEGTEVDEDEQPPTMADDNDNDGEDEFPPVFQSPDLSQPELFRRPALPDQNRLTRGLPARKGMSGRTLGKTVSAPVGGLWGNGSGDVDMDHGVQDGFDINEWAKEEF